MLSEQDQRRSAQGRRGDRPGHDQHDQRGLGGGPCARDKRQRDESGAGNRGHQHHEGAEPPDIGGDPVGGKSHRGVGDGEDRLIQHQDEDDRARCDADLCRELRQIDDIGGPAEREHQLQEGEIEAGAVGAGADLGLQLGRGHV